MENFEHLRRSETVLLTTRRNDGRVVHTPVNLAVAADGTGYFVTSSKAGKAKRLANFPGVRVAPCSRNGHPKGSDQPAVVARLGGADADRARRILSQRFPLIQGKLVPLVYRLARRLPVYYRLAPSEEPTPWSGVG
jgi:PPOX class probable F420-dependent enzyme